MYTLKIIRTDINPDKDCVFGDARFYDKNGHQFYQCVSLERYSKMIPEGDYIVNITYSPKFKRNLLHVCDVKGRSGIRIHPFNYSNESQGCISLGKFRSNFALYNSTVVCKRVQNLIELDCGECILKICHNV